jgi:hypothetical protein
MVIGVLTAVILLTIITFGLQSKGKQAGNDNIEWLGKGVNWDYQIKLSHKPIYQVQFISHGQSGANPCSAPNYAVEINEGLIYKGHGGSKFTSFKAVYEGSPAFVNPLSEMANGVPQGIESDKPYGTEHSACFTKDEWERMKKDQSNTVKVIVTAYPFENSIETISLKTAQ